MWRGTYGGVHGDTGGTYCGVYGALLKDDRSCGTGGWAWDGGGERLGFGA